MKFTSKLIAVLGLMQVLATSSAMAERRDPAEDPNSLMECQTIDPTFMPHYRLVVLSDDQTNDPGVTVVIEKTTWDADYQIVQTVESRAGHMTFGNRKVRLSFEGGTVRGRELPNGVYKSRLSVDDDRNLEATCELIFHIQPVGTIRN